MAGLYFHIPFCKSKCGYCDFYSITDVSARVKMVLAIEKELIQRKQSLAGETVSTIYFGGGTPSLLSIQEMQRLINTVFENYNVEPDAEITMEVNPDDASSTYIKGLKTLPVNRISMGVQSFFDDELRLMGRRHSGSQAETVVKSLQDEGFDNISIDLMYGLHKQSIKNWEVNVDKALALETTHMSSYHLTYEEGTPYHKKWRKGEFKSPSEDESNAFIRILNEKAVAAGFEHYEISNLAKHKKYSRHNTSYWQGVPYLGVGPSAHSFFTNSRSWNIASVNDYLEKVNAGEVHYQSEVLFDKDKFNEYILTRLRTKWGSNSAEMLQLFPADWIANMEQAITKWIGTHHVVKTDKGYALTVKGWMVSDSIYTDLMQ